MLIVSNLPLGLEEDEAAAIGAALRKLRARESQVARAAVHKKSLDARRQDRIRFVVSVAVELKDPQAEQALVIKLSGLMFVAGFVLAGFNFRFQWLVLPDWASWAAAAVFALSYLLYGEVLRENTYLSRTVEVQEGQKVIDTGLYSIVRHPMYSVTVLMFLTMPLILGSPLSFAIFLSYPAIIAKRIKNEEKVLAEGLAGYAAYQKKVKYKLVPFLW